MTYILHYRTPGKRPGTTRWAKRRVESTSDAVAWMNSNKDTAFLPAYVETPGNRWQNPETVAVLGSV